MAYRSDVEPRLARRRTSWYCTVLSLLVCLPLTACGLAGGPVSGRVLAEGTNQPIAGAIVVVKWEGDLPGFADSRTVCYHVASTRSDEAGRFRIPAWVTLPTHGWQARIINREHRVIAYAPGYAWSHQEPPSEEVVLLAPFKGTVEERLQYLSSVLGNSSCVSAGASGRTLYWLWMALHDEANTIAVSPDDRKRSEQLRSLAQGELVDRSKPTKPNEYGDIMNIDPRDNFKVEPLR